MHCCDLGGVSFYSFSCLSGNRSSAFWVIFVCNQRYWMCSTGLKHRITNAFRPTSELKWPVQWRDEANGENYKSTTKHTRVCMCVNNAVSVLNSDWLVDVALNSLAAAVTELCDWLFYLGRTCNRKVRISMGFSVISHGEGSPRRSRRGSTVSPTAPYYYYYYQDNVSCQ